MPPSRAEVSRTIAMALPCQSREDVSDDSYGCVVPKLYGRIGRQLWLCRTKAVRTYRAIAKAVSRQSCVDVSETMAKALSCQSSALSSEQARTPRLRLALS